MQRPCFLFGAKEASAATEYRGIMQRLPFLCNKTKTMDCKTEVIMEPKTASPPELFAGEDRFCQDSLYWLPPFKFTRRCWLPSHSIFGERTRASINRTSHHSRR